MHPVSDNARGQHHDMVRVLVYSVSLVNANDNGNNAHDKGQTAGARAPSVGQPIVAKENKEDQNDHQRGRGIASTG